MEHTTFTPFDFSICIDSLHGVVGLVDIISRMLSNTEQAETLYALTERAEQTIIHMESIVEPRLTEWESLEQGAEMNARVNFVGMAFAHLVSAVCGMMELEAAEGNLDPNTIPLATSALGIVDCIRVYLGVGGGES